MRSIYIVLFVFVFSAKAFPQAPQLISFQGVARDASGKLIANTTVSLRFSIHIPAAVIYSEKQSVQTSQNGIFTVNIGAGEVLSGTFSEIKWKYFQHYLQVEIDPTGQGNYVDLGKTQIVSVPYALHTAEANRWKNDDAIVQTGAIDEGSGLGLAGTGWRFQ